MSKEPEIPAGVVKVGAIVIDPEGHIAHSGFVFATSMTFAARELAVRYYLVSLLETKIQEELERGFRAAKTEVESSHVDDEDANGA
jgi:hypothetical protein